MDLFATPAKKGVRSRDELDRPLARRAGPLRAQQVRRMLQDANFQDAAADLLDPDARSDTSPRSLPDELFHTGLTPSSPARFESPRDGLFSDDELAEAGADVRGATETTSALDAFIHGLKVKAKKKGTPRKKRSLRPCSETTMELRRLLRPDDRSVTSMRAARGWLDFAGMDDDDAQELLCEDLLGE